MGNRSEIEKEEGSTRIQNLTANGLAMGYHILMDDRSKLKSFFHSIKEIIRNNANDIDETLLCYPRSHFQAMDLCEHEQELFFEIKKCLFINRSFVSLVSLIMLDA